MSQGLKPTSISKQGGLHGISTVENADITALRALLHEASMRLGGVEHVEMVQATARNGVPRAMEGQEPHAEHGVAIDHNIPQADAIQAMPDLWWSRTRHWLREPFSEFFGVFILILFGDGVVAQVVLSGGANGSYQSITWGWG